MADRKELINDGRIPLTEGELMNSQSEPHELIETMANHGPLCKQIKSDKESILKSTVLKRQLIYI